MTDQQQPQTTPAGPQEQVAPQGADAYPKDYDLAPRMPVQGTQPTPTTLAPTPAGASGGAQSLHPFEYQQPTAEQVQRIQAIRQSFKDLYDQLRNVIPPSRELSMAITKLEEASMWTNKGVVFNGGRPEIHP